MNSRKNIFEKVQQFIEFQNIKIYAVDTLRPWGGFFVIDEADATKFIAKFFPEINGSDLIPGAKLSPKILLVEPGKKLSWQYHHRRAEIWKLIEGEASVSKSLTDFEQPAEKMQIGKLIKLQQGERHRLIGEQNWGIVAEIWMHTDPSNPSNEDDIVRLQDDFGRGI